MSARRRPGRRNLIGMVAFAVALLGGGVALVIADSGAAKEDAEPREDPPLERIGSTVADGDRSLQITDQPASYRITYRVTNRGSAATTERLSVRRPFVGEAVTGSGDRELSRHRWAFGRLATGGDDQKPVVLAVSPATPGADLRLAPVLDDAIDRALLEKREQRTIAGRRCQVYRAGTTVLEGTLKAPSDPDAEHADVCFDAEGLLLEEWWVVDGEAIRQRVATKVEERAPADLGDGWSDEPTSMPVDKGGGSVVRVTDTSSPPGAFFTLAAPAGFEHLGRYAVVPPQAEPFDPTGDRSRVVASTVDVWRRGIDAVVLDQGGSLGGLPVYVLDPDHESVEVPGLGTAELIFGLAGNEVRVAREHGRFVRIVGTLPMDDLLDLARSLVETPGTELVVEDGPLLRD